MTFMADVSSGSDKFGISKEVGQPGEVVSWPSVRISDPEAMNLFKNAINYHADYLLARSWFNRVWVVQEAALVADLTVSCGHASMSWTSFARALEVIRRAYRQIPLGEERSRLEGIKAASALVRLQDSFRMLDKRGEINHHRITTLVGKQMYNKACTDDRDRVYAMLGMTRSPYTIKPDYDKTVAEAYTEFTRCYSPNTQIFMAGLCRRQYHLNPGDEGFESNSDEQGIVDISSRDYLPSWVPDFRPELNLKWVWPFCCSYDNALRSAFWFLPHPKIPSVMGSAFNNFLHDSSSFVEELANEVFNVTPICNMYPYWISSGWIDPPSDDENSDDEEPTYINLMHESIRKTMSAMKSIYEDCVDVADESRAVQALKLTFDWRKSMHDEVMYRRNRPQLTDRTGLGPFFAKMHFEDCDKSLRLTCSVLQHDTSEDYTGSLDYMIQVENPWSFSGARYVLQIYNRRGCRAWSY